MRLYSFTNANYLKEIQCGIQTAHLVHEIFVNHLSREPASPPYKTLIDWAILHKTIIVCNGGNHKELNNIYSSLQTLGKKLKLPYGYFQEDEESLNKTTTAVGIVVPDTIYNLSSEEAPFILDEYSLELHTLIKSKKLA